MIKEIRRLLAYLKYIVLREEVQDGEIEKKILSLRPLVCKENETKVY